MGDEVDVKQVCSKALRPLRVDAVLEVTAEFGYPQAMTIEEVRRHRAEILALAGRRGITAIRVFGSVARGDAHLGSDVDLIVEVEPGRSILAQAGFQAEVEALLGVPVHTLELPEDPRDLVSSAALADAVPL